MSKEFLQWFESNYARPSEDNHDGLVEYYNDRLFAWLAWQAAIEHTEKQHSEMIDRAMKVVKSVNRNHPPATGVMFTYQNNFHLGDK